MTEQPVDTSTAAGKTFLDMLGVSAEIELSFDAGDDTTLKARRE